MTNAPQTLSVVPKPSHPVPAQLVGKNWQPGVSGNPNGRPRLAPEKVRFTEVCRSMLASKRINIEYTFPDAKKGVLLTKTFRIESDKTIYHSLVAALIREALGGNVQAIKELIERCETEPEDTTHGALVIQMKREIIDKRPLSAKIEDRTTQDSTILEALPIETVTTSPDIVLNSTPDILKEALKTNFASENAENAIYEQNITKNDDTMPIESQSPNITKNEPIEPPILEALPIADPSTGGRIEDMSIEDILEPFEPEEPTSNG